MKTHYGVHGVRACPDKSVLGETTTDLQAVDCLPCLWNLWGQNLAAVDMIANRVREVVEQRKGTVIHEARS